jgi:hypothetical protein
LFVRARCRRSIDCNADRREVALATAAAGAGTPDDLPDGLIEKARVVIDLTPTRLRE